jgi:hypothetical protein
MKSRTKETLDGMLSSVLLQLASGKERHKILLDAYNSDMHMGPPFCSSLLTYFERMLAVPSNVILIVDALDEHSIPHNVLLRFLTNCYAITMTTYISLLQAAMSLISMIPWKVSVL